MIKTYLQAITDALDTAMQSDESVVIIGEDVGLYGGGMGATKGLIEKYKEERVMDVPISETAFTGAAVGASILGMKPVVEIIFSDFTSLTVDPIVNHAAKLHFMSAGQINVPIVVRTPLGAGTGAAAQHSQSLEAIFLNTPGLKVLAPSTPFDAKGMLISAIFDNSPVVFFEHKLLYKLSGDVGDGFYKVPLGKANISHEGSDISLISYSYMSKMCLNAAQALEKDGISAEVIDLRSLRPLDTKTIFSSVKKTGRALVVQEAPGFGGFAGEIVSLLSESCFQSLKAPIRRLCGNEMPIAYNQYVESAQLPSEKKIIETVKEIIS